MCGRFVFTDPWRIKALLPEVSIDEQIIGDFRPSYNIAPSQPVLAVLNDGTRALHYTRWGLIPAWSQDRAVGYKLINARVETLAERPMFRRLAEKRRCLIFADGFYEWRREGGGKRPYFIRRATGEPFAFAGLWDVWRGAGGDILSSTIITTAAEALLRPIHARMPVILPPNRYPAWLSSGTVSLKDLSGCLNARAPEDLEAYAVTAMVNSPAHHGPECIRPALG